MCVWILIEKIQLFLWVDVKKKNLFPGQVYPQRLKSSVSQGKQPVCEAWFCRSWSGVGGQGEPVHSAYIMPLYVCMHMYTHTYAQAPFSGCPAPRHWLGPSGSHPAPASGQQQQADPLAWAPLPPLPARMGRSGCRQHHMRETRHPQAPLRPS